MLPLSVSTMSILMREILAWNIHSSKGKKGSQSHVFTNEPQKQGQVDPAVNSTHEYPGPALYYPIA